VGQLQLRYEKLPIPGTDRQTLVLYHAEPGSASAAALALLEANAAPAAELMSDPGGTSLNHEPERTGPFMTR
jgi:hypothetical protein